MSFYLVAHFLVEYCFGGVLIFGTLYTKYKSFIQGITDIFGHSVGCLIIVSFAVQKIFSLIQFCLLILEIISCPSHQNLSAQRYFLAFEAAD